MNEQPTTLEPRIAVALQPDTAITSADLAALIEETETNIAKADQTVDHLASPDPAAARQAMMANIAANQLRLFDTEIAGALRAGARARASSSVAG